MSQLQNVDVKVTDKTILLTIEKDKTLEGKEAGTQTTGKNEDGSPKIRKNDLCASTGGFHQIQDGFSISVNVNRTPKATKK